jgi:WASH complex subunit 7
MDDPWDEEGSLRRACSEQLQRALLGVQEHERTLRDVEEATRPMPFATPELNYCPIRLAMEPAERVFPHDLVHTDNQQLGKVLTVFVYLCDEINELKDMAEAKLYGPLVSFGQTPCPASAEEEAAEQGGYPPGARERMVGRVLPTLQELCNFVDRCYFVAVNLVQQMSALLNPKDALYRSVFHSCQLQQLFVSLGDLLAVLVTLDRIVDENDVLRDSWAQYKVMMSYARADPGSFGMDADKVAVFEKMLLSIDQSIMGGEIFKGCIEQDFQFLAGVNNGPDMELNVRKNSTFLESLLSNLKASLESSMRVVGTNSEFFERAQVCGCFTLYALYRQLLPANIAPDLKLHKLFWSVQKTVPWVFLCNQKTIWFPGDFLLDYSSAFDCRKLDPPNPSVFRKTYLSQFDAAFSQRVASISAQSKAWFILADSYVIASVRHESSVSQALEVRAGVLLKGLSVAVRASYLLRSYLVVHESMEEPVSKSALAEVGTLIEVLKGLEYTFVRKQTEIALSYALCLRHYAGGLLTLLDPMQSKLETSRKLDSNRHDALGVISVLKNVLKSSDSMPYARLMVVTIAADTLLGAAGLGEKEAEKMKLIVKRISCLSQLSKSIRIVCDVQFLYYHRSIYAYLIQV